MKIGYHCHGGDFAKVVGRTAWELFGENTKADVLLQLDIGNCLGGGGGPIAMLKQFPMRRFLERGGQTRAGERRLGALCTELHDR